MPGLRDTRKIQMLACVSQGSYMQHKESRHRMKDCHQERSSGLFNPSSCGFFQEGTAHKSRHVVSPRLSFPVLM